MNQGFGLSVNPISGQVYLYIFLLILGARNFPSRRATVCDCY